MAAALCIAKAGNSPNKFADLLNLQNINADFYHAGLPYEIRNKKQETWLNNTTSVMVCTNAFGMGIDKA